MAWTIDDAVNAYVDKRLGQIASGVGVSYKMPRTGEVAGDGFRSYNTPDALLETLGLARRKHDVVGRNRRDTVVSVSLTVVGERVSKTGYSGSVLSEKLLGVVRAGVVIERADCPDRIVEYEALVDVGALAVIRGVDNRRGRVPKNKYSPTQSGLGFVRELEAGLVDETDPMILANASHFIPAE